jgi:hypothetical protein
MGQLYPIGFADETHFTRLLRFSQRLPEAQASSCRALCKSVGRPTRRVVPIHMWHLSEAMMLSCDRQTDRQTNGMHVRACCYTGKLLFVCEYRRHMQEQGSTAFFSNNCEESIGAHRGLLLAACAFGVDGGIGTVGRELTSTGCSKQGAFECAHSRKVLYIPYIYAGGRKHIYIYIYMCVCAGGAKLILSVLVESFSFGTR